VTEQQYKAGEQASDDAATAAKAEQSTKRRQTHRQTAVSALRTVGGRGKGRAARAQRARAVSSVLTSSLLLVAAAALPGVLLCFALLCFFG
jgi:hypothetical protein